MMSMDIAAIPRDLARATTVAIRGNEAVSDHLRRLLVETGRVHSMATKFKFNFFRSFVVELALAGFVLNRLSTAYEASSPSVCIEQFILELLRPSHDPAGNRSGSQS